MLVMVGSSHSLFYLKFIRQDNQKIAKACSNANTSGIYTAIYWRENDVIYSPLHLLIFSGTLLIYIYDYNSILETEAYDHQFSSMGKQNGQLIQLPHVINSKTHLIIKCTMI